jgi:hypothetical protein
MPDNSLMRFFQSPDDADASLAHYIAYRSNDTDAKISLCPGVYFIPPSADFAFIGVDITDMLRVQDDIDDIACIFDEAYETIQTSGTADFFFHLHISYIAFQYKASMSIIPLVSD